MDDFLKTAVSHCPIAESIFLGLGHICNSAFLDELFKKYQGSTRKRMLALQDMVSIVSDAILQYEGSARAAINHSKLPTSRQAFYNKLSSIPLELSEALLREGTGRLTDLIPRNCSEEVPKSLAKFRIGIIDGKKIKNVGKRLSIARRFDGGKLLGAKALVLFDPAQGMIIAAQGELDGERNDGPLVPGLMDQLAMVPSKPSWLLVADRQYCDLTSPVRFIEDGNEFLIRYHCRTKFQVCTTRSAQPSEDSQQRKISEQWGILGSPKSKKRLEVRRIRVHREGMEDLEVVTSLLDSKRYPAKDILDLYFRRWDIETMFNKLSEVFSLLRLIGCKPRATFFQFSLCCLIYNLLHLIRMHIGKSKKLAAREVSMQQLQKEAVKQLSGLFLFGKQQEILEIIEIPSDPSICQKKMKGLLSRAWKPILKKAKNKPRTKQPPDKVSIPGGHTSVQRLINQAKNSPS